MKNRNFTCADYRKEMTLVQLRRKFSHGSLNPEEKKALQKEIEELEIEMGMN